MADFVRMNPFQEMMSLRDAMNQLVADSYVRPTGFTGTYQPPMDVYETDGEYMIKLAAPGLEPDNFDITVQQNVLTIHGHTQGEEKAGTKKNGDGGARGNRYHLQELRFGEFTRTVEFPTPVQADKIEANLANGILTIRVPKAEEAKPKKIAVQVKK